MNDKFYLTNEIAIINFDLACPETKSGLIKTPGFKMLTLKYLDYLKHRDPDVYEWVLDGNSPEEAVDEILQLLRTALVFDASEIESKYLDGTDNILTFVDLYFDFWKAHDRYSVSTSKISIAGSTEYVDRDHTFNELVRNTFRTLEQSLTGKKIRVFRQQPSSTNGAISCYKAPNVGLSERYAFLKKTKFIDSIMLRTPMLLHPKSNKREGLFKEVDRNPAYTFEGNTNEYFCFPAKVGSLLIDICFHRDYIANGISCANLFELATPQEASQKPDGIVIFGNPDGLDECSFYHDWDEDVWIGSVSSNKKIEYFGYMKKMVLTIHNVIMLNKGWLPIHGAFIKVTLMNGLSKGICLMGDSGAGKSETIEAMKALGNDRIKKIDVVFDDMGTFHVEDGVVYAQGTEIGAFVRLDDLDAGAPYRDMNRSIFFNPEQINSRVITPAAPYKTVVSNHKIDLFAYANNYEDCLGLRKIDDITAAKDIFVRGRRMAKGTTQEQGLSETYFANPFGPMQMQEKCEPILDEVFATLEKNETFIGEAFTHLGINPEGDDINLAAQALLDFIENGAEA